MTRPILALVLVAGLAAGGIAVVSTTAIGDAVADEVRADAGVAPAPAAATTTTATVETPTGTATTTVTTLPAVDNPITDTGAAFDDLRAAKKLGWPALVIVALTALMLGLGTVFPKLAKGSAAFLLACGTTGLLAAGNTVLAEGSWVSVATAALLAGFGYWRADREKAARDRALKESAKASL